MTGPVYLLFREFTQSARRSTQGAYASGLHHLLQSAVIGLNWTLDDATRIMREFAVLRGKYRFRLDEVFEQSEADVLRRSVVVER